VASTTDPDAPLRIRLGRFGGLLAVGVSLIVGFLVGIVSDVGFNAANLATLLACGIGGAIAATWPASRALVAIGLVSVILGMLPALMGGVGLLYVPSVVCLTIATIRRS
jgi:hypothetical protein